jgi:stage II sporulation protein D (peptidoglycan lytic transglycosylase)
VNVSTVDPRRRSAILIAAAFLVAVTACTSTGGGPPSGSSSPSVTEPGPPSPSGSVEPPGQGGIVSKPVRIRPPAGGSLLVHGAYPRVKSKCKHPEQPSLTARYPGTISITPSEEGTLAVTVTLPFERYLEGIAEVPPSWPRAALEAQAIAARSYALATTGWDGAQGETLATPICGTTACQVYGGIPVPRVPGMRRWYRAVRDTAGEVLLYHGRPADTVYFSTSNGRTYGNDEVFGSDPLPYLRPVAERDDGASPTSHWRVRLPFPDLTRFLRAAGEWGPGAISGVRPRGAGVMVSGGGRSRVLDLSAFRDAVNIWAPCLAPARYPPGRLPVTIPSRWMTISPAERAVVVSGRGWGHGVGMTQWGAYGKARRGLSAAEILAFYYGGLQPRRHPEPGLIHVQVGTGLTGLRIRPSGPGATINGKEAEPGELAFSADAA